MLYLNGKAVVGFGASASEAAYCPAGSTPTFRPDGTYQCLRPDGSTPIKPSFQLTPPFTKCGDGMELQGDRCYDPRDWSAQTTAGKDVTVRNATFAERHPIAVAGIVFAAVSSAVILLARR